MAIWLLLLPALLAPSRKPSEARLLRNVLVVGDSISQLSLNTPGALGDQLRANGFRITGTGSETNSDSFGGFTSLNLFTLLGECPKPPADIILTQSGTNDALIYPDKPRMKGGRIKLLLRLRAMYPAASILVNPIPPCISSKTAANKNIAGINADTKAFIAANPSQHFVWTGDFKLEDWPDSAFQPDGIHPIASKVVWLANRWMASIKANEGSRASVRTR
jgi:hypothetical protein